MKKLFILLAFLSLGHCPVFAQNSIPEYFDYCGKHLDGKVLHLGVGFLVGATFYSISGVPDWRLKDPPVNPRKLWAPIVAATVLGFWFKEFPDIQDYHESAVHCVGDLMIDDLGALLGALTVDLAFPQKREKEPTFNVSFGPYSQLVLKF